VDLQRPRYRRAGAPTFDAAFAILALRSAGAAGLDSSISWLVKVQNDDGGWGDTPGSPSTADGTGAVLQAIPGTDAARRGLAYLRKAQRPSGGFALGGAGSVNSQSTAWAVQGMLAMGMDPASVRSDGKSALDYLSARQNADGSFAYSPSSDQTPVWVTGQALAAVAGDSFPLAPVKRQAAPSSPSPGGVPDGSSTPAAPLPGLPPSGGGAVRRCAASQRDARKPPHCAARTSACTISRACSTTA